jgi:hypothetical protein
MSAPLRIHAAATSSVVDDSGTALARDATAAPAPTVGGFKFLREDAIEQLAEPTWLVEGLIVRSSTCVLFGPPWIGKSFVALDLSLSVATGTPFLGRSVKAGPVLYIMAEGDSGLKRRFAAWKHRKAIGRIPYFQCLPQAVDLLSWEQVELLVTSIKNQCSPLPVLVVIDTLHRCFAGGDENSARDMGLLIKAMDYVRRQTKAAVLVVHHLGKKGASERGSSALRGAVDTMFAMTASPAVTLSCEKQKDGAPFETIALGLRPWLNSCVVELETGQEANDLEAKPQLCLDVLRESGPDGLTHGEWATQCKQRGVRSSSFDRARKTLIGEGYATHSEVTGRYAAVLGDILESGPVSAVPA